ncbi:addiction module protein [Ningiella sp. W23]|uniref:addiction module protein n=1 Tax=Ningiella sp. W23 TaxID=3023715 RepID=UPI00375657D2
MTQISKELVNDALALSTNERVALVEQLLQSLNAPNDEINEVWAKEADARVLAYENNEISSKSFPEVLKKYK